MALTIRELDAMPNGARVEDADGDIWTKDPQGLWGLSTGDEFYDGRTSENIYGFYGPFHTLPAEKAPEPESEPEVVIEGVWIVWSSITKESINAVFPADAEVSALRKVNRDGFGYAQFQPFGEVTY